MPELRNIAIIAHVDHGKTTLVDGMLKQGNVFRRADEMGERVMDRFALERERGITIVSKNTAITYRGVKINVIDTPGHADFGGEVERVLSMADGALLLVDAVDGPMPQTRFVLLRALEMGLKVIVVINKIDRAEARPQVVLNDTFDLFLQLGANDEQADFPVVYTNARAGTATLDPSVPGEDLQPLFQAILEHVPAPKGDADADFQMLVTALDYDDFRGRIVIGRIANGRPKPNQSVSLLRRDGTRSLGRLVTVFTHDGLRRVETTEGQVGDIIAVTGLADAQVGDTIAAGEAVALPQAIIEEPTVRMTFGVNTSPFSGREGQFCTSPLLRQRLYRELETNVALRVEDGASGDQFLVSGRGELHLGILIETMRREGFELEVSQPEVILKEEGGQRLEPYETVTVDVTEAATGAVVEQMGSRRGEMQDMQYLPNGQVRMVFVIPTRGLLGFRTQILMDTRGEAIVSSIFSGYHRWAGPIQERRFGSLVATDTGSTTPTGLEVAQARGSLFIGPQTPVYAGMVVGQHQREGDLEVNVCKLKALNNIRRSTAEEAIRLTPPVQMSLDQALEYIGADELVEVTPKTVRIRKRILDANLRAKAAKTRQLAAV